MTAILWTYKLSPDAQKLDLETVLRTLAKHGMDFTAAARELEVKTIDLYRFASRNPRVLDDLFGAELDRVSKSVAWFDQALSGEHGINGFLDSVICHRTSHRANLHRDRDLAFALSSDRCE